MIKYIKIIFRLLNPGSIYRKARIYLDRDVFDIINGTDTALPVSRDILFSKLESNDVKYMNYYVGGLTSRINSALRKLISIDSSVLHYSFFDLGSGKGKVLILAERAGFTKITGVEISEELNKICRKNLEIVESKNIQLIESDASSIDIPNNDCVFYIYNSFEIPLLNKVLDNIERSFIQNPRNCYIIYIDPKSLSDYKKFRLDEKKYTLLYSDNAKLNPFHIYKLI